MENMETNQTPEQDERTFTQAELDSIIKSRLADEKKKYADYDALKEKAGQAESLQTELDQLKTTNSINQMRSAVSKETGVPVELLVGDDEESCRAYAEKILIKVSHSSFAFIMLPPITFNLSHLAFLRIPASISIRKLPYCATSIFAYFHCIYLPCKNNGESTLRRSTAVGCFSTHLFLIFPRIIKM